jgi:hypothetical protein
MQMPRVVWTAVAVALLVGWVAACGGRHDGGAASSRLHAVPTSSWEPGDASLAALGRGTLAGGYVHGTFCVWLTGGQRRTPVVWPAGYHARLHPFALLDSQDRVAARLGDRIAAEGGEGPVNPHRACMLGERYAFYVMSGVTKISN